MLQDFIDVFIDTSGVHHITGCNKSAINQNECATHNIIVIINNNIQK